MVRVDFDRDYYGDLALQSTCNTQEIKAQFKKLALKWHPDRNIGREEEAKAKFVQIQSAQEVLLDVVKRAKYDAELRSRVRRHPPASGVRGNPWQNVSQQYPAPPRRPPPRSTGASRYSQFASNPLPKSPQSSNPRDNAKAWERMRPTAGGASSGASQPRATNFPPRGPATNGPPPTPRTASQRQKAEASFGRRKTGFTAASHGGDDRPVPSKNYFTTKIHTSLFNDSSPVEEKIVEPVSASSFVDPLAKHFGETFLDTRQSTPYTSKAGEKTNPFEGVGRSKTVREPASKLQNRAGAASPARHQRHRSFSVGGTEQLKTTGVEKGEEPEDQNSVPRSAQQPVASRPVPSGRADPKSVPSTSALPRAKGPAPPSDSAVTQNGSRASPNDRPPVYESPFLSAKFWTPKVHLYPERLSLFSSCLDEERISALPKSNHAQPVNPVESRGAPSGAPFSTSKFDASMHSVLDNLITGKTRSSLGSTSYYDGNSSTFSPDQRHYSTPHTNTINNYSFNVPAGQSAWQQPPDRQSPFTSRSADNINMQFTAGGGDAKYQFQAGGLPEEDLFLAAKRKAQSKLKSRSQSPKKQAFIAAKQASLDVSQPRTNSPIQASAFNACDWTEQIRAFNFVPVQGSQSPTRPTRAARKTKGSKVTGGKAVLVDDESSSSEDKTQPRPCAGGVDVCANEMPSPMPMDIDTPPPEPKIIDQNEPRNIPVEPSRPEWRAGDIKAVKSELPANGLGLSGPTAIHPFQPNSAGSEDSDFLVRPNVFAEFTNIEPFAPSGTGLGSIGDLGANLPFNSKPAPTVSVSKKASKPLVFPSPPAAPQLPKLAAGGLRSNANAWTHYFRDFEAYFTRYCDFNATITDHFMARRRKTEATRSASGFPWLTATGGAGRQEYLRGLDEDRVVREKWAAAAVEHEQHVREFEALCELMKQ